MVESRCRTAWSGHTSPDPSSLPVRAGHGARTHRHWGACAPPTPLLPPLPAPHPALAWARQGPGFVRGVYAEYADVLRSDDLN